MSPTIIKILIIGIERLSVPFLLVISDIVANIAVINIKLIESIKLYCKNNPPRDYTNLTSISWTTPDGFFDIYMRIRSNKLTFRAMPVPVYQNNGYGVSGCYNPQTGATKVVEQTRRMGRSIPYVDC